ncbi:VWA domain-containing protein [Methylobacterium radiodurans]|uniref:Magnesium chelatase ATPase subunit D n=1 Tax=Methylobacterium radiodurans TaxID=2202828 RepID=A0A2U8VUD5_9HYPH|nr:VWA domain-containing protein [Methylobacterium radiodurans]AWN37373.1 magnesium chelatase ATPase subunit D [Methylobacterium radiodurans]
MSHAQGEAYQEAPWATALRVAALLAAAPHELGGVVVRAGAGPVRERWLEALRVALDARPLRRLPPGTGDDRLIGGLDLPATLALGRPVLGRGLLAEADGGVLVVAMAERMSPATAARLAAALDTGAVAVERDGIGARLPARIGLVLLDEGEGDETVPEGLADRLAFRIDLDGIGLGETQAPDAHASADDCVPASRADGPRAFPPPSAEEGGPRVSEGRERGPQLPARGRPSRRAVPQSEAWFPSPDPLRGPPSPAEGGGGVVGAGVSNEGPQRDLTQETPGDPATDPVATLCTTAAALGIASPRGSLLALRVARRIAGTGAPDAGALAEAARLVLAPRATCLPVPEAPPDPAEVPQDEAQDEDRDGSAPEPPPDDEPDDASAAPEDVVLAAARAAIPADLLAKLAGAAPRAAPAARAGRFGAGAPDPRRGRPAGARPGDPRRGRLDLLATLRAAAPWQRLRPGPQPIRVRASDLRVRRLVRAPETTTIVCVDASGSAARERLAETKGAVELMLAEAYARRDRVALVAFRGAGAEIVLPPTRALARARRDLAGLPGGGGTPLAAGLDVAAGLARGVARGGGRPVVVVLTDGRANVARSRMAGRAAARADAEDAARMLGALGLPVLVLDTGAAGEGARALAAAAGARYATLPRADAAALAAAARNAGA